MKKYTKGNLFPIILCVVLTSPLTAIAQSDGSLSPTDAPALISEEIPATATTSDPLIIPVIPITATQTSLPTTTKPSVSPVSATPTSTAILISPLSNLVTTSTQTSLMPVEVPTTVTSTPLSGDTNGNPMTLALLVILAVPLIGYIVARLFKGKEREDDCSRCYEIRKLLQKKWEELTDVRGQIDGKLTDVVRGEIREAVKDTTAGNILAIAEKIEKEYGKLKKLFDECMIEFERNAYHGVLIENSLIDQKILDKMKIEKTDRIKDQTVDHVFVGKKLVAEFSQHMTDGPWLAYFWKPEKNDMKVVFKNKVFSIKSGDKSTWVDAVSYGKSIGIPDEQLNFSIE